MRLLFLAESFPTSTKVDLTGGVEAGDWFVATGLAKNHQVTVVTAARKGIPARETIRNVQILRVGQPVVPTLRETPFARMSYLNAVLEVVPQLDFELIHASNAFTQYIAIQLHKKLKKPIIARIPDIFKGSWIKNTNLLTGIIGEYIESKVLTYPWSAVISWSEATKLKLVQAGVNEKVITVVPGGIDVEAIIKSPVVKRSSPVIVSVGRLVKYKHMDALIESMNLLSRKYPRLKLEIIGSGPEKKNLVRLIEKRGLSQRVNILGFVESHKQVVKRIKSGTIFSLPSSVEGFGIATLEACAAGIPYVNLDIPATSEITHQGKGGFLVDSPNPELLAEQISALLQDKKLYNTKARECISLARHYDWTNCTQKSEKIFKKVLSRK